MTPLQRLFVTTLVRAAATSLCISLVPTASRLWVKAERQASRTARRARHEAKAIRVGVHAYRMYRRL